MKSMFRIALAALLAYGFMGLSHFTVANAQTATSPTLQGSVPKGKPFRYLHSRIDALQQQIDALIGHVDSLREWQEQAQEALLILQEDTAANKAAIALLESEIANVSSLVETKQDIISGTCPDGQYVYEISQGPAELVCRADMGANGLIVETVMVSNSIPANSSEVVTAECSTGAIPMGGSYEAAPGLEITSSGIEGNGFAVNVANTTVDGLLLNVTATCVGIAP